MRKCRYCNKEITDDVSFCYYCGKKIATISKNELEDDTSFYCKESRNTRKSGKYAKNTPTKRRSRPKRKPLLMMVLLPIIIIIALALWLIFQSATTSEYSTGVRPKSFIKQWNSAARTNPQGVTQGRQISIDDIGQDIQLDGYIIYIRPTQFTPTSEIETVECYFSEGQPIIQASVLELLSFAYPRMSNATRLQYEKMIEFQASKSSSGLFERYSVHFENRFEQTYIYASPISTAPESGSVLSVPTIQSEEPLNNETATDFEIVSGSENVIIISAKNYMVECPYCGYTSQAMGTSSIFTEIKNHYAGETISFGFGFMCASQFQGGCQENSTYNITVKFK